MAARSPVLLAVLTALLTTGALLVTPWSAEPARAADATAQSTTGPPTVGQCRTLTYRQMQTPSDQSDVVPCQHSHTANTVAVPAFPDGIDPATATQDSLVAAAQELCAKATTPYFRGSHVRRDMALWSWAYFIPTPSQLAAGADWVECDVVVVWPGRTLMPLPKMRKPLYAAREPRAALACHTAGLAVVPCTEKHRWRPVGGFDVKQAGYPTKARFLAYGQQCHAITGSSRYLITYPPKKSWKAGDHAVVCSTPSTTA